MSYHTKFLHDVLKEIVKHHHNINEDDILKKGLTSTYEFYSRPFESISGFFKHAFVTYDWLPQSEKTAIIFTMI